MRCQDARCLIISKINALEMEAQEKIIRIRSYDELALKTFIRGLPTAIQTVVRLRNPDNLERAMSFVIEEENFLYATKQSNNINSYFYKPTEKIIPSKPTEYFPNTLNQNRTPTNSRGPGMVKQTGTPTMSQKPTYPQFYTQRPNSQNQFQRTTIQNNNQSPYRANFNRPPNQTYNSYPQNINQAPNTNPRQNYPNNTYKPTPMSISTRNTNLNKIETDPITPDGTEEPIYYQPDDTPNQEEIDEIPTEQDNYYDPDNFLE